MANRDDQPFRGLEPDHYRRSGLKDAVSHYLSPPNPLTSTAPQPFPNNLTMPSGQWYVGFRQHPHARYPLAVGVVDDIAAAGNGPKHVCAAVVKEQDH